jgi:hypothetical protein
MLNKNYSMLIRLGIKNALYNINKSKGVMRWTGLLLK